jgi:hypothetical protein
MEQAGMTDPQQDDAPASVALFNEEVEKIRAKLTTTRSATLLQIFNFLVERSNDDRAPKEIEIALAVFGRNRTGDAISQPLDSGVRVYVHRLRKRLADFYAGKTGAKLEIPKGEYRIVLVAQAPASESAVPDREPEPQPASGFDARRLLGLLPVLPALFIGGLGLWFLWSSLRIEPSGQKLRATAFWQPLRGGPTHLVVGDSFLIAETENQRDVQRMVLEPGIHSRENLGTYLQTHPEAFYRLYDLDLNFAPVGTTIAAWDVQRAIDRFRVNDTGHVPLIPASRLEPDMLETEDIVYVGRFASLGRLAPLLSQVSQLRLGDRYNELVDMPSGKHFVSDIDSAQAPGMRTDYGYIASLSAPLGKHIFVIAGIGDTAIQNMASLVSNPEQLRAIEAGAGIHGHYEALFEVKVMDDVALTRNTILARALHVIGKNAGRHAATLSGQWQDTWIVCHYVLNINHQEEGKARQTSRPEVEHPPRAVGVAAKPSSATKDPDEHI